MVVTGETRDLAGLDEALGAIAARTAEVTGADVVVVRLVDDSGAAGARAVHAESAALRAELEGSRVPARAVPAEPLEERDRLPPPLLRAAEQLGASGVLQLPVREGNAVVGSLELLRRRGEFVGRDRTLALAAADEIALARRAFGDGGALGRRCARPARSRRGRAGGRFRRGPRGRPGGDTRGRGDRRERLRRLALRAAGAGAGRALGHCASGRGGARGRRVGRATCPARSRSSRWRKAAPS